MDVELEQAEIAAMRVQWTCFPSGTVRVVGGLHVLTGRGAPWLTQVCGFGLRPDQDLDAALAAAPAAQLSVVDGQLAEGELVRRGYRPATRLLRLVAPAQPRDQADAEGLHVAGPDDAAAVELVAARGFALELPGWWSGPLGRPGWTQLLCREEGEPVATAALHVSGACGWIGAAATVPQARGRGHHRLLLARRLSLAAEQGARRVAVKCEAGTVSHRNLLGSWFVEAYGLTQWAP